MKKQECVYNVVMVSLILIVFNAIIYNGIGNNNKVKNLNYLDKNLKYGKVKDFEEYKLEINDILNDNHKTIRALMKRSLFLENIIYNIDRELKNLTWYFDRDCNRKKIKICSH